MPGYAMWSYALPPMVNSAMRRLGAGLLALVAVALMGGCAERAPQTAMVAASPDGGYGYSDQRLAPDFYAVHYVSPELSLPADEDARSRQLDTEKARAFDLALWRSSQIAAAEGFSYLKVEEDHRDASVDVKREYAPPPALGLSGYYGLGGSMYSPWGFYGQPPGLVPYWFYQDPYAVQQYSVKVSGRVTSSLKVAFAKAPAPGFEDAAALGKRLSQQYAGVTYP
jgi:hypothetical protein